MSKKTKILHISHTDIRTDGRILKELDVLLLTNNYQIHAFGLNRDMTARIGDLNEKIRIKSFACLSLNLNFLPRSIKFSLLFIESSFKIIFNGIILRPHIIHCHDALFLPFAFIIKLFLGSKLIYDAHELESLKNGQSKMLSRATLLIEKICWKKIDLLISVSPSIINWYMINVGFKQSQLILNTPNIKGLGDEQNIDRSYFRNKYGIESKKKIFLYIGILCDGRSINLCLDVFTKFLIDSHVIFLGYGVLEEEIQNLSRQHKNIHFHQAVPYSDVVKYARSADFGLCLIEPISKSDYYCLPNKLFEYIFSGITVIGSDLPEIRSIISEYNLGYVTKLNVNDLANTFRKSKRITFDSDKIFNLSWQNQANQLTKQYFELTKNL